MRGDKKGNKVLNKEVNYKLGRGTWFGGDLVSFSRILISGKSETRFCIFSLFPSPKVLPLI